MPEGSDPLRISIIIVSLISLTIVNGFFASAEMAVISVRKDKLNQLNQEQNKRAQILAKLLAQPTRFLSTIQVSITLAGFMASAIAGSNLSPVVVNLFKQINVNLSQDLAMIIVTLVLSYFSLVFGELIPKRLALRSPEKVALRSARIVNFMMVIASPFVRFLSASTNLFLRIFGVSKLSESEKISEDEIRSMIVTGHIEGLIDEAEKEMFDSIFKFDDLEAETIMTPRTHVFAINVEDDFTRHIDRIINSGFSRIPIFRGDKDNIIGILHVKDLLKAANEVGFENVDLCKIIRKPYFAPSHIKINVLFKKMKETNNHIAILIDEHGGSLGIVTMEDLIEEIVGNIYDEHDKIDQNIKQLDDTHYIISGSMPIHDLNRALKLTIDEDDDEFDTLGGLIISKLGFIPKDTNHEEIKYQNLSLKAHKLSHNRIDEVWLEIHPQQNGFSQIHDQETL